MNKIALASGALGLAGLIVWAVQPQSVPVETSEVKRGAFEQTVSDDGKTRVRERYMLSAPLAARAERNRLKAGDRVQEGEVVAVLTPSAPALLDVRTERELNERVGAADAQRMRAMAQVQRADAQLAQAKAERARAERLSKDGFVSAAAREQADLAVRTADKELEATKFAEHAAEHEAQMARAALAHYRSAGQDRTSRGVQWMVRSPVRGLVLKVEQESEGVVTLGAPLLEIGDTRSLEAVVDVLTQDAVAIKPGMRARIDLGAGVVPVAAQVRLVEPAAFTKVSALGVEEQRVNVVLDFGEPLDQIQTIGDGFRVDAHIVVFRSDDAVKAPVAALFRDRGGWAVFVVENDRAMKRAVQVTHRNGVEALIEKGLQPGEMVVLYPSDALQDGARVKVLKRSAALPTHFAQRGA